MTDSRFKDMYTMTDVGLKRSNDVFQRNISVGEQFSRIINGIDPLIERANLIKENAEDIEILGRDLRPIVDDKGIKLMVGDRPFYLTEWSMGQFSSAVGIPSSYAIEMVKAKKIDLFLQNFESWIESHIQGKKFLIRTFDDHVRGVLSERYIPVDSHFMLPQLQAGLMKSNMDFRIDKSILNPEYTNIRFLSNRTIDIGGDPHYAGFQYSSSDVGRAGFRLSFFVYRSKCSNGMFFGRHGGTLLNQRHTAKELVSEGFFVKQTEQVVGNIDKLVEAASFALRNARAVSLRNEDIQSVIDRFRSSTSFGKKATDTLFETVKQKVSLYDDRLSLWAVSNALTEAAQDYTAEKAEVVEDFAGHLLFAKIGIAA